VTKGAHDATDLISVHRGRMATRPLPADYRGRTIRT
jgi:hypothetical protein